MLRLIPLNKTQTDVLYELVTLVEVPLNDRADIMAGLTQFSQYMEKTGIKDKLRLVLTNNLLEQVKTVLDYPFLPADADRLGIPQDHYLHMVSQIPSIRLAFENGEMVHPNFLATKLDLPSDGYLN